MALTACLDGACQVFVRVPHGDLHHLYCYTTVRSWLPALATAAWPPAGCATVPHCPPAAPLRPPAPPTAPETELLPPRAHLPVHVACHCGPEQFLPAARGAVELPGYAGDPVNGSAFKLEPQRSASARAHTCCCLASSSCDCSCCKTFDCCATRLWMAAVASADCWASSRAAKASCSEMLPISRVAMWLVHLSALVDEIAVKRCGFAYIWLVVVHIERGHKHIQT